MSNKISCNCHSSTVTDKYNTQILTGDNIANKKLCEILCERQILGNLEIWIFTKLLVKLCEVQITVSNHFAEEMFGISKLIFCVKNVYHCHNLHAF